MSAFEAGMGSLVTAAAIASAGWLFWRHKAPVPPPQVQVLLLALLGAGVVLVAAGLAHG